MLQSGAIIVYQYLLLMDSFVSSFGEHGNKKDQFTNPRGITLDNEGYLYICDCFNNRLVMY